MAASPPDWMDARRQRQGAAADRQVQGFQRGLRLSDAGRLHAEKVDHHPEFTSVWNRVDFRLTSHDAGGVTERDIALAEAINH